MAEEICFASERDFETWLDDKPVEWAQILALRIALRILPLVGSGISIDDKEVPVWRKSLLTSAFRCIHLSSAVPLGYRTAEDKDWILAARAARAALDSALAARTAIDTLDPTRDVRAAALAARTALDATRDAQAVRTARAAARAAALAARDAKAVRTAVRSALDADAQWLGDHSKDSNRLIFEPLWHKVELIWFNKYFLDIRSHPTIVNDWGFKPWLDWYAALVPLDGSDRPYDYFGPVITRLIIKQSDAWWEKDDGAAANHDIDGWLHDRGETASEESPRLSDIATDPLTAYETAAVAKAPVSVLAEADFDWDGERRQIVPAPLTAHPPNPNMAQTLLEELRDKVSNLLGDLARSNATDQRMPKSLTNLLEVLPTRVSDLNPGKLLSRGRSVESDAAIYPIQDPGEVELFPGALSALDDVAESLKYLKAAFPEIREIERERRAQKIQDIGVSTVATAMDQLASAAHGDAAPVVSEEAQAILRAKVSAIADEPRAKVQEEIAAEAMLVKQNFESTLFRKAVSSIVKEAREMGAEYWKDTKPALVKGSVYGTIGGITALLHYYTHPMAGWVFLAGASKNEAKELAEMGLGLIKNFIGRFKPGSATDPTAPIDESNPSPSTGEGGTEGSG